MSHPCGPPHKLTRAQIRRVLRWHARGVAFRATHGTARDLARKLHASIYAVRRALQGDRTHVSKGAVGRKRLLPPAQHVILRRWRAAGRRFRARHLTAQQLADALGVSRVTIHDCIRRRGRYATVDPVHVNSRSLGGRPGTTRHATTPTVAKGAALLKAWPRVVSPAEPRRITGSQVIPSRAPRDDRS
jgi:hypothetical protein